MAGVVQLVAIGAQDKFLTENPTVSFFRQKYNHHTNFSHDPEENGHPGNPGNCESDFHYKGRSHR